MRLRPTAHGYECPDAEAVALRPRQAAVCE
jgi:hypothetical protein